MITKSTRKLALAASLFLAPVSFQSVLAADLGSLTSSISSATEAATSTVDTASKIDINTATADQLSTISGIGTAIAESIVEYREKNGDFSNLTDLTNISGIGSATLAKILPYLTL
ncbi:helix-hairpin-helix domain-containing protein [Psychromonas aquatilis]|uniref:Helix-hairpin-helix domain-containing protein n=2 Tax=Gammaproteobacteria TaxID=1236 RepID=A0ABU9GM20_9GAMM